MKWRAIVLALILVVMKSVAAPKQCRLPTAASVAGAWVGADDSFNYRLAIQPDGRGGFGIRDHLGTVYVYSFDSIAFDGPRLALQLQPRDPKDGPIVVTGRAPCSRPEFKFKFAGNRFRVVFHSDDEWRQAQGELDKALAGLHE